MVAPLQTAFDLPISRTFYRTPQGVKSPSDPHDTVRWQEGPRQMWWPPSQSEARGWQRQGIRSHQLPPQAYPRPPVAAQATAQKKDEWTSVALFVGFGILMLLLIDILVRRAKQGF